MKRSKVSIVPKRRRPKKPFLIAITGTPGTGKTLLAKKLSLLLNANYLNLNKLALKRGLKEGFDRQRKVYIINEKGLYRVIKPLLRSLKAYVADSHLSHHLPVSKVSFCIVARCDLKTLKNRLKRRKYAPRKIAENLEAEALGICLGEARELGHNVIEINCSKQIPKSKFIQILRQVRT